MLNLANNNRVKASPGKTIDSLGSTQQQTKGSVFLAGDGQKFSTRTEGFQQLFDTIKNSPNTVAKRSFNAGFSNTRQSFNHQYQENMNTPIDDVFL